MVDKPPMHNTSNELPPLLMGTAAWGDKLMWGYGSQFHRGDLREAFVASLEAGFMHFDTSETFGQGMAEMLLGEFAQEAGLPVQVSTKFMPLFWRLNHRSLVSALNNSLKRLKMKQVFLYELQMPLPPRTIETWMDSFAEVQQEGLVRHIGVCNVDLDHLQRAITALSAAGGRLYSCQIELNLLNFNSELARLIAYCQNQGIKVIAHSPLAKGLLSGKYSADALPTGVRQLETSPSRLDKASALLQSMRGVVIAHAGATFAQVAINWLRAKQIHPIVAAKTAGQMHEILGSVEWELSRAEVEYLDTKAMDH